MLAQVILTPAESKKLIGKAVARMPAVQRACENGMVVVHPSSSTYFVAEEILGKKPGAPVWLCGAIVPKGACSEMGGFSQEESVNKTMVKNGKYDAGGFRNAMVIKNGYLSQGTPIRDILEEMGPDDVYVKGGNALDVEGNVGIIIGDTTGAGSIGEVIAAQRKKGFRIILPIGLEKLIPVPLNVAVKAARMREYAMGMGIGCGLLPCRVGEAVTEVKAFEILSGATATPIAAGGLGGAEGAVTIVIEGDDEAVTKAYTYAEQCKGAQLPEVRLRNCVACKAFNCTFPVGNKPWVLW